MNADPVALIALIAELYATAAARQTEVEQLRARIAQLEAEAEEK